MADDGQFAQDLWLSTVRQAKEACTPLTLDALEMPGDEADNVGSTGIQKIACDAGKPVVVRDGSRFHSGKVFWPC